MYIIVARLALKDLHRKETFWFGYGDTNGLFKLCV